MELRELVELEPAALRRHAHHAVTDDRRAARAELFRRRLELFETPAIGSLLQELRHVCGLNSLFSKVDKVAAIRELVAKGAPAYGADERGVTPAHHLAQAGPPEALAVLVELGAVLDAVDDDGRTLLHRACTSLGPREDVVADGLPKRAAMISYLLAHGAVVDAPDVNRRTALHGAAGDLDATCCALLLDAGASLEAASGQGTPLAWAVDAVNLATVELLLARGALVDPALLERARQHAKVHARLKKHLGVADDGPTSAAGALEALRVAARELGKELGEAAVRTGDLEYAQENGDDESDLSASAFDGTAREQLAERLEVLPAELQQALGESEALLEGLYDAFREGWVVGLEA